MNRLFFLFSLVATFTLPSCTECDHGYGPDDCDKTWADQLAGNWQLASTCQGQTVTGTSFIVSEGTTRIRFDGDFYGELSDWNKFDIPSQIIPTQNGNFTLTGSGTITNESTVLVNGQTSGSGKKIIMTHNYSGNGQNFSCSFELLK